MNSVKTKYFQKQSTVSQDMLTQRLNKYFYCDPSGTIHKKHQMFLTKIEEFNYFYSQNAVIKSNDSLQLISAQAIDFPFDLDTDLDFDHFDNNYSFNYSTVSLKFNNQILHFSTVFDALCVFTTDNVFYCSKVPNVDRRERRFQKAAVQDNQLFVTNGSQLFACEITVNEHFEKNCMRFRESHSPYKAYFYEVHTFDSYQIRILGIKERILVRDLYNNKYYEVHNGKVGQIFVDVDKEKLSICQQVGNEKYLVGFIPENHQLSKLEDLVGKRMIAITVQGDQFVLIEGKQSKFGYPIVKNGMWDFDQGDFEEQMGFDRNNLEKQSPCNIVIERRSGHIPLLRQIMFIQSKKTLALIEAHKDDLLTQERIELKQRQLQEMICGFEIQCNFIHGGYEIVSTFENWLKIMVSDNKRNKLNTQQIKMKVETFNNMLSVPNFHFEFQNSSCKQIAQFDKQQLDIFQEYSIIPINVICQDIGHYELPYLINTINFSKYRQEQIVELIKSSIRCENIQYMQALLKCAEPLVIEKIALRNYCLEQHNYQWANQFFGMDLNAYELLIQCVVYNIQMDGAKLIEQLSKQNAFSADLKDMNSQSSSQNSDQAHFQTALLASIDCKNQFFFDKLSPLEFERSQKIDRYLIHNALRNGLKCDQFILRSANIVNEQGLFMSKLIYFERVQVPDEIFRQVLEKEKWLLFSHRVQVPVCVFDEYFGMDLVNWCRNLFTDDNQQEVLDYFLRVRGQKQVNPDVFGRTERNLELFQQQQRQWREWEEREGGKLDLTVDVD